MKVSVADHDRLAVRSGFGGGIGANYTARAGEVFH